MLVLFGVIGELIFEYTKWVKDKEQRDRLKRTCGLILVLGLIVEMPEQARIRERAGRAEEKAAKAYEHASSNEVRVAELVKSNLSLSITLEGIRSSNREIKLSMADRVLSYRDIDEIERVLAGSKLTNGSPKVMVLSVEGKEPEELAEQIRLIFQLGPNFELFTNQVLEQFKPHIPNGVTVEILKRGSRTKGDVEAWKAVGHCEALASELVNELNNRIHAGATNRNVWQEDDIKNGNGNAWKFEPLWMVVWVGSKLTPPL